MEVKLHARELLFRSGGERLFFRTWDPPVPRGSVVIVHGMGEHSGRYEALARALRGSGFAAASYDLRGHGRSTGRRGDIRRFDEHVDDLGVFLRVLTDGGRPQPRFIVGHNLGGLIALHLVMRDPAAEVRGLVLSSPALRLRVEPGSGKRKAAQLLASLLPAVGLPNDVRPVHLTRDSRAARDLARDPHVHGRTTPRAYLETLAAMESARARAPQLTLPVLILAGTHDAFVSPQAMRDFLDASSSSDRRMILYTDFYHDVLHESGRERVVDDILRWLEARH